MIPTDMHMRLLAGKQYSEEASSLTVPWIFETSSFSCIILYPPIAIAEVHCLLTGYHYWLSWRLQEAGKIEIPFDVLNHSDFPAGHQMSQDKSLEHKRIKKKKINTTQKHIQCSVQNIGIKSIKCWHSFCDF